MVWSATVGEEKTSGRFMRVGSVARPCGAALFTGYARDRGGGSGDAMV